MHRKAFAAAPHETARCEPRHELTLESFQDPDIQASAGRRRGG
jgi:hypothetical protein